MDTVATASGVADPPHHILVPISRRAAAFTVALLSMSYMVSYFDRILMVVLAQTIKVEFALSDTQLSLLTGGAFIITYGILGVGAGWMIDRFNRTRILAVALTLWSVMTMACGMAGNFVQLALARAGVGVGEATNVPVGLSMVADMYPPEKRPLASAFFYAGGMVGILGAFLLGTYLAETYGWRMAFYLSGPPGIVLAVLIFFFVKEPPREQSAHIFDDNGKKMGGFRLIFRNRPLIWLAAGGALSSYIAVGMIHWLSVFFIRSHGMSMSEIGFYFGPVLACGTAAGMIAGGWIGNHMAGKSVLNLIRACIWLSLGVIPFFLLVLWTPNLVLALVCTFVATASSVLWSPMYTAAWQTVCDPAARGTMAGISSFAAQVLGGAVCSFIVGMLSDWFAPTYGADSLRQALTWSLLFCAGGAALFARSAYLLKRQEMAQHAHLVVTAPVQPGH